MRRLSIALILIIGLACSSLSPRAQLVTTHDGVEKLLAAVDDSERILCFGSTTMPAVPTKCTTPAAVAAKLTDDRHVALSRALYKAFSAQVALGKVIQTWVPGQPVDMSMLTSAVAEVDVQLALLDIKAPNLSGLLADILKWKAEIERLRALFGGGR